MTRKNKSQRQRKFRNLREVLTVGGFLILFAGEGMTALSKPAFGVDVLEATNPIVVDQLRKWDIHTVPSWGKRKIAFENKQEFLDIPPREFLRIHPHLADYRVIILDTAADLGAFIAYRLLEKYNQHNEEMNITHLSQIKKLLDAPLFMESFIRFLHLQATMITLMSLENAILSAAAEKEGWAPDDSMYSVTLPLSIKTANGVFLKKISEEANLAWTKVIRMRNHILR